VAANAEFFDELGLWQLVRRVVPRASGGRILVIDGMSRGARVLARVLDLCGLGPRVAELDFDFVDDVRLTAGTRGLDEIYYHASAALLRRVETNPRYPAVVRARARAEVHVPYIHAYTSKRFADEVYRDLRSALVVDWYRRRQPECGAHPLLHLKDRWLLDLIAQYAAERGIRVRGVPQFRASWRNLKRRSRALAGPLVRGLAGRNGPRGKLGGTPPRVAVEMYLNGVGRDPLYGTEFFWYRPATMPPATVFGYFLQPQDQPTQIRQAKLAEAGLGWIDRRDALRLMYSPDRRAIVPTAARRSSRGALSADSFTRALAGYVREFYVEYERWRRFFAATATGIHVSMSDVFAASEALHAALADIGGVSVSIQRSIEQEPFFLRRTVTDVHFAFCQAQAERERRSGSQVRQFITVGYPFDAALPAARAYGRQLRADLQSRGARFVICFFDENSGIHPKWKGGTRHVLEDYGFLCDRLAADPTLGLVLKPKQPGTLPQRLGPLWNRVGKFIDGGRCVFLGGSSLDDRFLPCVGACAADIAIGMAVGATAGLESYLAGTKTLLIRHDADPGAFIRLPKGRVLFETWEELWAAVELVRTSKGDGIGDWELIIDEFVSLRDGVAAERIGNYISWLRDALARGCSREVAMVDAGERYSAAWGSELITEIRQPVLGARYGGVIGGDHEVPSLS